MRKVIVDCDLTVVDTGSLWFNWLCEMAGEPEVDYILKGLGWKSSTETTGEWAITTKLSNYMPYNLGYLFPAVENPMNFWKELDYTNLAPMEGSVDALEKISKHCSIIFASHIEGDHGRTKYYWLKKHFPFLDGVMFTREKYLLNSNEVVGVFDDRLSHLSGFEVHKRIQIDTPYTQDGYEETIVAQSFSDWRDFNVEKWLKEVL